MPFTAIATSPVSSSGTSSCFPSSLPPKQPRPIGNGQSQSENTNSIPRRGHNSRNHNNNNHSCSHNLMNINKAYNNNNVGDKKGLRRGKDTAVVAPVGVSSIIQCARNNYCRRRSSSKGRCESEESSYRSYNDNFDLLPDAAHTHISAFVSANGSENDNDLLNHNQNQPKAPHDHLEDELKYFTDQVERTQLPALHRPASLALHKETEFDLEFYNDNRKNINKYSKSCFGVPDDFKQDLFQKSATTRRKQGTKPTFTSYLGLESPSSHVAAATASSWLWQKSLSEGNLSSVSAVDAEEKSGRYHLGEDSKSNCKTEQCQQQQQEKVAGKSFMTSGGGGRTRLFRNNSLGPADYYYKDKSYDDEENELVLRPNPVPKFFRSISLRNLLQIGGMNKSRPAPAQGKRVSPPTAPLVSFPSFRVKKSQQQQQQKSETFELQQQHTTQQEKEQQRYSGSSLGSAGSSYASSGSSGSDNRSSIGTDDGFLVSPTVYANGYLKDLDEYHPVTQGILLNNSSNSYESFASSAVCAPSPHHSTDMHQSLYAKVGGTNSGSNGASNNGPGGTNGVPSPHVTVHVDPHPHPISNSTGAGSGSLQQQQPHNQNLHQLHGGPNNVFQPSSHNQPLTTSHYQTQISLEDQGIDMTQSPGRESPSSTASSNTGSGSGSAIGSVGSGSGSNGCRHSTASFDSGRASSTIYQGVRYSGLSSESSSGSFRHSYHSSSSSLGSIPPEEICNFDVSAMISQGIPDHEVLNAWLTGIHFECYYQNFIQAGYDMHTISRMTPEDLNAIGVTKPHHRKRLKSEISQLNISDGLPEYIPASIEEWLGLLKLEEYNIKLRGQGYHSVRQVTNITWEDLEDIGILKLGHQKKFMLAIKRVEDILAGKRIPSTTTPNAYLTPMQRPLSNTCTQHIGMPYSHPNQNNIPANSTNSHQYHHHPTSFPRGLTPQQHQLQQNLWRQQQQQQNSSASSIYSTGMQMQLHTHQPQIHNLPQQQQQQQSQNQPVGVTQPQYHPEVISIHVKNGRRKSLDNPDEEPIYGTSSFLPSTTSGSTWQRSQSKMPDDGETTPTNESSNSYYSTSTTSSTNSSTSTLPRLLKNKPISKIMGGADLGNNYLASPSQGQPAQNPQVPHYGDGYKSLPRDIGRLSKTGSLGIYQQSGYANAGATGTLGKNSGYGAMGKNGPPPPPRRGSCSGEPLSGHFNSFQQQGNLGFSANNGSWANLPPPPPTLSCDAQFTTPSKSTEEFPPPPPPDDLVMMSPQSVQSSSSSSKSAASSTSTSSSTSPNNPSQPLKMSTVVSHVAQSTYHNTTNSTGYHPSNVNSNAGGGSTIGGGGVMRTSPPHVKSRDPSPVGSDFSDSDLPANNGLLSRGVRRNGSDASFKSNSSTESESIPFANDNAGTIKQQKPGSRGQPVANSTTQPTSPENDGTGDVLNDIGNMLADLTDELDAILEQEMSSKR